MTHVGFLYNCSAKTDPRLMMSASLVNRAVLVDERLRDAGHRLFVYSPRHFREGVTEVPGYTIEDRRFVAGTHPIPRVNGNWTFHSRRLLDEHGMGYEAFLAWARRDGLGIYVPYEFSDLVSSKLRTYECVRAFDAGLHPHTERYDHSVEQAARFLDGRDSVFLKRNGGNMGNRIIVLRRDGAKFTATFYELDGATVTSLPTLDAAVAHVRELAGDTTYVIQPGLDTLRVDGSVFDVRVIMLHDGNHWHWIHEARVGAPGSDLSNIHVGGAARDTREVLAAALGARAGDGLAALDAAAFGLAAYLDRQFPGRLIEIAFDFLFEYPGRLRLAEINSKPGMVGVDAHTTVFERGPDQEAIFGRSVVPHATCLARFLQSKIERLDRDAA